MTAYKSDPPLLPHTPFPTPEPIRYVPQGGYEFPKDFRTVFLTDTDSKIVVIEPGTSQIVLNASYPPDRGPYSLTVQEISGLATPYVQNPDIELPIFAAISDRQGLLHVESGTKGVTCEYDADIRVGATYPLFGSSCFVTISNLGSRVATYRTLLQRGRPTDMDACTRSVRVVGIPTGLVMVPAYATKLVLNFSSAFPALNAGFLNVFSRTGTIVDIQLFDFNYNAGQMVFNLPPDSFTVAISAGAPIVGAITTFTFNLSL